MTSDPVSDHDPDHHRDRSDTPFLGISPPHPAPDKPSDGLPETPPHQHVWCYDQPAQGKRGKHRRYHGYVKRIGGTEGERIRRELAATIYDLLLWAKQQQTNTSQTDSGKDGAADDNPA